MALLSREFIAVPDDKHQILFKWPDHNIRKGSQLIVEPDMQALLIARGEIVDVFPPGRFTIDHGEIPALGVLIDASTGGNAYRTELYFVGTHEYVGQKFGGRIDDVQDPQSQLLVSLRVFGDYSLEVVNPADLILQLTGTVDVADNNAVAGWIAEQLLKAMRTLVTRQVVNGTWPVVSTSAFTAEIESGSVAGANELLATYGVKLSRLGNFEISLDPEDAEKLKKLAEDIRRSQLAGGYAQMAQVEMMQGAAAGMAQGGGAGPALMGIGVNMGGMASQPPPQSPVPPPVDLAPQAAGAAQASSAHPCPSCQTPVALGAKFCANCGTAQAISSHCTNCGTELAAGSRFCSNCGTARGI